MIIRFHFMCEVKLVRRRELKFFIEKIFESEVTDAKRVDVIFCDDDFLLKINRDFLQHNYLTDIVSFNLNELITPILGEIYISEERVRENAKKLKTFFNEELHRVIFHGILHFCGFDDKKKKDKSIMRQKENYYLDKYFVSRGT
ncbi:MAG: rRNA maturation RNase YbeY [Ferruginibacter sp.]